MLDPRYLDYLLQHHGVLLEVQALERTEEGPRVRRRVRYRPTTCHPVGRGPSQSPEWFAFVEQSTYDRSRKEMTFSNVPTSGAISRMLMNTGTLRLRPSGGGTERTVEGESSCELPFLLKPLAMIGERLIHSAEGWKSSTPRLRCSTGTSPRWCGRGRREPALTPRRASAGPAWPAGPIAFRAPTSRTTVTPGRSSRSCRSTTTPSVAKDAAGILGPGRPHLPRHRGHPHPRGRPRLRQAGVGAPPAAGPARTTSPSRWTSRPST